MTTPLRRQYLEVKRRYPDALLLFRLGDFYEVFGEDAEVAARDMEVVLTRREFGRGEMVPMAGVPHHALETYLGRLLRKGHRVAICEQLTEPGKGLVERDVVRVVTPGTVLEPTLLERSVNNYLAAVAVADGRAGVAHVDVSTGEFAVAEVPVDRLGEELSRLAPVEVVVPRREEGVELPGIDRGAYTLSPADPVAFVPSRARRRLLEFFGVHSLEAYGCEELPLATAAAGAVLDYLERTHRSVLAQLQGLRAYATESFMALDAQTRRNLELFEGGRWGGKEQSLLRVLDCTESPMGARLLRRWLAEPLLDIGTLRRRHDAVGWLVERGVSRRRLQVLLRGVGDVERALHRIGAGVAVPREVVALRRALEVVPEAGDLVAEGGEALDWMRHELVPCPEVVAVIAAAIADEPEGEVGGGGVVRRGFSAELDELRMAASNARAYIAGLEARERERTQIGSLKVGYNRVFGYYLEVSNAHREKVPADYLRRQTLVHAERYVTPELKEHENRVLNARERLEELEAALYRQVCRQVADRAAEVGRSARALAAVDVLSALAEAAVRHGYVRPDLEEGGVVVVAGGRHPVVERHLPSGSFVPNDVHLDREADQVLVLTGPNMAGKSTYLRQVALIVLMAQAGSFVPAESARIGLVDRIFTRVGAQDHLAAGQSTFMVEMVETAHILHHATPRSLVVLDEIGRGTSTYDGMSIAQAVVEFLHNTPRLGCRTLFATHYHELIALADRLPRVRNYTVAVAEEGGDVVFLHRIVPGGADRSYGVHVAQLAGLPRAVVQRAWELLAGLEGRAQESRGAGRRPAPAQPPLFAEGPPVSAAMEALRALELESLTPIESLNKLYELQRLASDEADGGPGTGPVGGA